MRVGVAMRARALEAHLDSGTLVSERYVLQVSSPGERPLRTPAEWRRDLVPVTVEGLEGCREMFGI